MALPPYGYDDGGVVHQRQLMVLIDNFEGSLRKVSRVFEKTVPHIPWSEIKETDFYHLRQAADHLGAGYSELVNNLAHDYEHFKGAPTEDGLKLLFRDIERIKSLLMP